MTLLNICLSVFILQEATLSPELPLGQPKLDTVDREGHSLPGEFFLPSKSMLDNNILSDETTYDTPQRPVLLDPGEGFLTPALPTESSPLNHSLLKRRTPSMSFPQLRSPGS